ncbi:MAG: phage shock protein operon transcriptional activator [Pseudomonadales bacterium]|nr:phage shock protein operon transcriptional activator [Pseudomonadales bacterium]
MTRDESQTRLIGESAAFLEVLELTSKVAPLNKPVLIVGERGTGKELIAARLHYLSHRWDQQFLKMNCAAISESLLETELFGHEAGAFTGAQKQHLGRFERAHKGSLFMDELATTSATVQEKLLRVIEYGEFERLGGSKTISTDVRLIAATNTDLPTLARDGIFREDLLDRLAFDVITLPPLRYREDDILILAEHFAVAMTIELGLEYFPGFSTTARKILRTYFWPGNVRELKNVVERSIYRNQENNTLIDNICLDPFESPYRPTPNIRPAKIPRPDNSPPDKQHSGASTGNSLTEGVDLQTGAAQQPSGPSQAAPRQNFPIDLRLTMKNIEIELIKNALASHQFKQKQTAQALGVSYHQLRGYLKKYNLLENP